VSTLSGPARLPQIRSQRVQRHERVRRLHRDPYL
jgi:hypothetical protein